MRRAANKNKTIAGGNRSLIHGSYGYTWEELFAFCMVIVAVVSLVFQMHDNK